MSDETFASATRLAGQIASGAIGSEELTRHYIERIERYDGPINAVVVRTFERALEAARKADRERARGRSLGSLHGVPMTIKESYVLEGTPATWGIPEYRDNVANRDGLVVARFKAAGAHFLGKTNVPRDLGDFQSYNEIYGTTGNPWNPDRTPGGSSGGSAAAMAAGFSALEAGSDIGGSIRNPAHFCGVFGHKPTWGIIPLSGHELIEGVPDADLSVCGPLARSAEDLALALHVMAGPVPGEALGWRLELPAARFEALRGLRVALWCNDPMAPVSSEIEARVREAGEVLAGLGAEVSEDARPGFDVRKAHQTYQSLLVAVMSSAQPVEVFEAARRRAAELDPEDDSAAAVDLRATVMYHRDWIRHDFRRAKLRRAWDAFFDEWDVLICPQMATAAFPHDHRPMHERTVLVDGEPRDYFEQLFWSGLATAPYLPSTVFPSGLSAEGLPIGLQAICGAYRDHDCIRVAQLASEVLGGFQAPAA